jgi:hypothetical protein
MLIAIAIFASSYVALVFMFAHARARLDASFSSEREAWTAERRELLSRIQRPEMIPPSAMAFSFPVSEEVDEIARVGQIDYDEEVPG